MDEDDDVPPDFICPISQALMTDPVTTEDGHSYERRQIEAWLKRGTISPNTGNELGSLAVTPNHALRMAIERWTQEHTQKPKSTAERELEVLRAANARLEEALAAATAQTAAMATPGEAAASMRAQAAALRHHNQDLSFRLDLLADECKSAATTASSSSSSSSGVGASGKAGRRRSQPAQPQPISFLASSAQATFKVIMIGASSVGKTSLAHYFTHGESCIDQAPTHGAKFDMLSWHLKAKPISLELWDTTGQERQMSTLHPYVRGADAVLLVFDLASLDSIKDLEQRFAHVLPALRLSHPPVVFLLANKVDRVEPSLAGRSGEERRGEEKRGEERSVEGKEGDDNNAAAAAADGDDDDDDEPFEPPDKAKLQEVLGNVLRSLREKMKNEVESNADGSSTAGLLSCYTVSAKTGHNCKEVVEQLQLRIAYRQMRMGHLKRPPPAKNMVRLRGSEAMARRKPPCCS